MKFKVIALIELVLIVCLAGLLVSKIVTFGKTGPVVRTPRSPGESTLSYTPPPPPKVNVDLLKNLAKLKKAFTPKVTKIADDIYYASGFALGGVQMVITDDGLVIVDTTESREAAAEILAEFRKITNKPIRYIIYTHGHIDHVYGSLVFMEEGTEVIATRDAISFLEKDFGWLADFQNRSRQIQFGDIAEQSAGAESSHHRLAPDGVVSSG